MYFRPTFALLRSVVFPENGKHASTSKSMFVNHPNSLHLHIRSRTRKLYTQCSMCSRTFFTCLRIFCVFSSVPCFCFLCTRGYRRGSRCSRWTTCTGSCRVGSAIDAYHSRCTTHAPWNLSQKSTVTKSVSLLDTCCFVLSLVVFVELKSVSGRNGEKANFRKRLRSCCRVEKFNRVLNNGDVLSLKLWKRENKFASAKDTSKIMVGFDLVPIISWRTEKNTEKSKNLSTVISWFPNCNFFQSFGNLQVYQGTGSSEPMEENIDFWRSRCATWGFNIRAWAENSYYGGGGW